MLASFFYKKANRVEIFDYFKQNYILHKDCVGFLTSQKGGELNA